MDFDQLAALEKLRSMNSQKELVRIQAKEAQLRQQLSAIQAYRHDLHGTDPSLTPMRSIGADVLWHKWLDQTQSTLNMSLARLLMQKQSIVQRARKDIGRSETVAVMRDRSQVDRNAQGKKAMLDKMLELSAMTQAHRLKG